MTPEGLEATIPYFVTRAGGVSKKIALAHYVLGHRTAVTMEMVGTSKQNIVTTLARFADAYGKYQQVSRNIASAPEMVAEVSPQNDPSDTLPAKAVKVLAMKAAARKVSATKAPAEKASPPPCGCRRPESPPGSKTLKRCGCR